VNRLWARIWQVKHGLAGLYAMNKSNYHPDYNLHPRLDWVKDFVLHYFSKRKLVWPSFKDAMQWAQTELAEVYELDLARSGDWVRNNPQDHPPFDKDKLAEELGDAIFMLIVAGLVEGVDPLEAMINKMIRKLQK
jgi:hypothetical protein